VILIFLSGCEVTPKRPAGPALVVDQRANRLVFAGDVMLSRGVEREIQAAGDPALPFRKMAPVLADADITFLNLESPFTDGKPPLGGDLVFHANPDTIAGLLLAHVSIASTANNHARDCGPRGVEFTVSWLRSHGIETLGSSTSAEITHHGVILTRHGIRFGFLGYTYDQQNGNWNDIDSRIALANPATMVRDVQELRGRADVVIVSMHHGVEYMPRPSAAQVTFAHAAIDAGAQLVVGHHPHVVQPHERYHDGLIFYSLGNFIFDQYQRQNTQHGEVVQVSFAGRDITATRVIPVKITPTGPEMENMATPYLAPGLSPPN
jgi:poly-gamma-glutamate capsule biosynthesis protein CapA/YwtB (metallophosphatase superfamily)